MAQIANVKIVDNSAEILKAFTEQVQNGLMAIGEEAEGYAKDDTPVDTGRLRNSICWAIKDNHATGEDRDTPKSNPEEGSLYIGTNVEYAEKVETIPMQHKSGKAHFLRDAAAQHGDEYRKIMEASLKS